MDWQACFLDLDHYHIADRELDRQLQSVIQSITQNFRLTEDEMGPGMAPAQRNRDNAGVH